MTPPIEDVARALHPLDAPPQSPGRDHAQLPDLTGNIPRVSAAVLVALRDSAQPTVIFTLRTGGLRTHAGQVSFPGGAMETGDVDVVATALRESREEIGLDPGGAQPLGYLDCLETVSGYRITPVVARLAGNAILTPEPGEVAALFEVPLAWLLDPANLRQRDIFTHGRRREVYEYAGTPHLIWGATAAILVNLMQRMGIRWPTHTAR